MPREEQIGRTSESQKLSKDGNRFGVDEYKNNIIQGDEKCLLGRIFHGDLWIYF